MDAIRRLVLRSQIMTIEDARDEIDRMCRDSDNSAEYHQRGCWFNQLHPARFRDTQRACKSSSFSWGVYMRSYAEYQDLICSSSPAGGTFCELLMARIGCLVTRGIRKPVPSSGPVIGSPHLMTGLFDSGFKVVKYHIPFDPMRVLLLKLPSTSPGAEPTHSEWAVLWRTMKFLWELKPADLLPQEIRGSPAVG
jgi:hypothetical protein